MATRKRRKPPPPLSDLVRELLARHVPIGADRTTPAGVVDGWLAFHQRRYQTPADFVDAWEAIAIAVGAGRLTGPTWLLDYLAHVATQMGHLSRDRIPTDAIGVAIARAMGFVPTAGQNPFRSRTDLAHDLSIAFNVATALSLYGGKRYLAYDAVAREHPATCTRSPKCESLDPDTVRRIWLRLGGRFRQGHPGANLSR